MVQLLQCQLESPVSNNVIQSYKTVPVQAWVHFRTGCDGSQNAHGIVWDVPKSLDSTGGANMPPGNFGPSKPPGVFAAPNSAHSGATSCANIIAQIEAGGNAKKAALAALQGTVQELAFDKFGCRVIQKVIEEADPRTAGALAAELRGFVREAAMCPNANFVIQKIVQALPASFARFVAQELAGTAVTVAQHKCGCRVLCRLVEHTLSEENTAALVDELLNNTLALSRHAFGHFVIQSILEQGSEEQRKRISQQLLQNSIVQEAQSRSARYVVESALEFCLEDRQAMINQLIANPDNLVILATNPNGCHVVQTILRMPGDHVRHVLAVLNAASETLRGCKNGRRLLEEIGPHRL